MEIHVTQADIDAGNFASICSCPVALSLTRTTGKIAGVGQSRAFIGDSIDGVELPYAATDFIRRFDRKEHVHPFTFPLDL